LHAAEFGSFVAIVNRARPHFSARLWKRVPVGPLWSWRHYNLAPS
jgi:hypothetical protein